MKISVAKTLRIFLFVMAGLFIFFSLPMLAVVLPMFFVCIAFAVFCFYFAHVIKKKYIPTMNKNTAIPSPSIPEGQMNYNLFEDIEENSALVYEYETEFFLTENAIDYIRGNGGMAVSFVQENNNSYDSAAIAIYRNEHKLGYIYRGGIQDMINDWIKRNHLFIGYINKYSVVKKSATIKIGFYKPLDSLPSIETKLVKTKKKIDEFSTRIDNLNSCEVGDEVSIFFDTFEEIYIVSNNWCREIGELSSQGAEFCRKFASNNIVGLITKLDNEDNKASVTVKLYAVSKKK